VIVRKQIAANGSRIVGTLNSVRLTLALAVLAFVGCAATAVKSPNDAARPLLAPSSLGVDRTANQIVRGAFGEREMTLTCVVTVKDGVMTVVGLSAMGIRLFTLRYDGVQTTIENTLPIPPQLTPERLLGDLQLVYWPLSVLDKSLQVAGWQVSEPTPGTRRLRRDNRLIAEVHFAGVDAWQGRSWLVNLEHGYTLSIESKGL